MIRRFNIVAGFFLVGVVVGWLAWRASGRREPVFEGRTLSNWLDHHVASSAASPPYGSPGWKEADDAIRHIGTNGIPTLLQMLRAKDRPPWVRKLIETARRFGLRRLQYRYAVDLHEEAEYAFEMLGSTAASAVPELIRIYEQNLSPSSQSCTALALGHIGRGAEAALPVLIHDFAHTNADVRFHAVSAVMSIGGNPEVVIPALTRALEDSQVNVRWNALVGLSMFGWRGRSAVPEILKMLNDPGMVGPESITQQVQTALWRIAPEKVGKPLVVEAATPMVVNGVTIEALKLDFLGERKTLIPLGRSIPAAAQCWNSDPRAGLALYRGSDASDAADHFLGRFEVLGLPAADNPNVSTLCVIADGQIVLCARDNNRDVFLEIRRVETGASK